ncbi:hypothetical protein BOTBODRAFT_59738 [Botryobasidium botryosum FD-172 SS1]|uniref:Fungal lipase-type domain-containing protein n=1 Tax=Botryobasidium botryosum (strain FD-172 SS1) TaxID=930990 RepID=A0A067LX86_BOTB1|nr:hypothetical protein BOTBODRAFT_59738 [Botryobasidium botryosum FD-172 SS1]
MLKAGIEALRAYESPQSTWEHTGGSVIDNIVPPSEALPLLAALCHSNYRNNVSYLQELLSPYEFELREVRREHEHGWMSRHKEGDEQHPKFATPPYVRIWYLQPNGTVTHEPEPLPGSKNPTSFVGVGSSESGFTQGGFERTTASVEHTGGLMIVSFTGSTTNSDWLDDARAFTHISASFLHPDLKSINAHHGFADWLMRRLDSQVKLKTEAPSLDPFTPRRLMERTSEPTVYHATLDAIADLRRGTKARGDGRIKMIVTGHSLGGAVASLFSLRLAASGKSDMSDSYDINCLHLDPDDGWFRKDPPILPVDLALAVTFGAPRFLWRGTEKSLEEQEKEVQAERDRREKHRQEHGFSPNFCYPAIPRLDDTPLARIVMQRDPVPHVPAGAGELPSGLNVLNVKQKPGSGTAVLDSQGPQAGEGAHTDGVSVPQEIGNNTYVHLGHQWVMGGDKPLEKLPSGSDKYIKKAWTVFKDLVSHNPWNDSMASQHYMGTYVKHAAEVYVANQAKA